MAEVSETLEYRFESKNLDDLRRDMQKLAGDFESLGDEAEDVGDEIERAFDQADSAADDFDTRDAQLALSKVAAQADRLEEKIDDLDGERINIQADLDVDRDTVSRLRSGGDTASRGRLPGELDEVQETVEFISALGPAAQASLAGVTVLAGALGASGGLAAAALTAANETGVLTDEIKALQARGKATARDFAQEFSGVLETDVIPTLRALLGLVQDADSGLADFTEDTFDTLRQLEQIRESGPLGRLVIGGPFAAIPGDQPFVPDGFGLSTLLRNLPEEGSTSRAEGAAARIENVLQTVGRKLEQARGQFAVRDLFGIEEASTLQQKVSTLEELRDRLIKTRAAVDLGQAPEQWRRLDSQIQNLQSSLENARAKLEDLRTEPPQVRTPRVTPDNRPITRNVSFEGALRLPQLDRVFVRLSSRLERINQMPFLPQSAQARRRTRAVVAAIRRLQQEGQLLSRTALKGFLRDLDLSDKKIKRIIKRLKQARDATGQLAATVKQVGADALAQSFRDVGKAIAGADSLLGSLKQTVAEVVAQLGRVLLIRGILSGNIGQAVFGGILSIAGGILESLDSGGKILSDGVAKVHKGEAVLPADVTRSLEGGSQPATMSLVQPGTTTVRGGGQLALQGGTAALDGDRISIPIELVHTANQNGAQVQRRKGRK